ncbi:hypothetical protein CC78DRAFT_469182, partial [Lojkania enalia]
ARCSPTALNKPFVGAVIGTGDTGEVLSTGYLIELPSYTEGDPPAVHTQSTWFFLLIRAEEHILDLLPDNAVPHTTMEPCNTRLSGNRMCCDRIVALKGKLRTIYVKIPKPNTPYRNRRRNSVSQ